MERLKEGGGERKRVFFAPLPPPPPPSYFCSRLIFRAGKTPKTPFVALCSTETLATQAKTNRLQISEEVVKLENLDVISKKKLDFKKLVLMSTDTNEPIQSLEDFNF